MGPSPEQWITGTLRLALEVDALGGEELVLQIRELLDAEDRFHALLPLASRAPLLERVRAANVCRAVAVAAMLAGGLEHVLRPERVARFLQVFGALYRDPEPAVGGRAAWAGGLLRDDPRVHAHVYSSWGGAGVTARRALVGDAARWQAGKLDDATFSGALREGVGKADVFARASAILGLRYGLHIDEGKSVALVRTFAADPSPFVRAAVGAFAEVLSDRAVRDDIVLEVRAACAGSLAGNARIWVEEGATECLLAWRALRTAARAGGAACMEEVPRVLDALEAARVAGPAEIHEALVDMLLLESSLVHDAAVAAARDDAERVHLVRRTEDLTVATWLRRVDGHLASEAASAESVRGLRRALDACPREVDLLDGWEDRSIRLTSSLLGRLAGEPRGELLRPLAAAFSASAESLVAQGCLSHADVVGALLGVGSARTLRHVHETSTGEARSAVASLATLREALDDAPRKGGKPVAPERLAAAVAGLATSTSALGEPVAAAMSDLLRATTTVLVPGASADSLAPWIKAIRALRAAHATAAARLVIAPPSDLEQVEVDHALRSLLAPAGLAEPGTERPLFGLKRAAKGVNLVLGPALAGLLDALLAAARAPASESPRPSRDPVGPGRNLGDYVVERVLGSGAMGHCLLVKRRLEKADPKARRWVLKIPQNDKLAAAFRDEAMMLITLSRQPHASIVRFVSFVDYGTRLPFLVMDFVEGEPLEHRIASAPLADDAFHAIGRDIASGLAFSHERGIAHYDVKPANIMLRADGGRAVLVDWGLAGSVVAIGGTPEYMAPERFDASGERLREAVVGASDVFALGCVLAGMRTGRELVSPAFTRDETTANPNLTAFAACAPDVARWYTCATIVASPEMLMRRAEPSLAVLPRAIAEIVARCLAKEPGARPSAREVADALSR